MSALFWGVSCIWLHVTKRMPIQHSNSYSRSGYHVVDSFMQATKQPLKLQKLPQFLLAWHSRQQGCRRAKRHRHCSQTTCSLSPRSVKKESNRTSHNTLTVQDDSSHDVAKTCRSAVQKRTSVQVRATKRGSQDAKPGSLVCETCNSLSHPSSAKIRANRMPGVVWQR